MNMKFMYMTESEFAKTKSLYFFCSYVSSNVTLIDLTLKKWSSVNVRHKIITDVSII